MIISCPKCKTKYRYDEDALPAGGVTMRCSRCRHEFHYPADEQVAAGDAAGQDGDEAVQGVAGQSHAEDGRDPVQDVVSGQDSSDAGLEGDQEEDREHVADDDADLEGLTSDQLDLSLEKKTRLRLPGKWWVWLSVFALLFALSGGVYYFWPTLEETFPFLKSSETRQKELLQKKAKWEEFAKEIALQNVRQYVVNNSKIGQLLVIEGDAVNKSRFPRELIKVKAEIYDAQGQVLSSKELLCGNSVSLYQLQMFNKKELESALTSKVGILTNNLNIVPGQSVHFMLTFYNPPSTMAQFSLKVVQAKPVTHEK